VEGWTDHRAPGSMLGMSGPSRPSSSPAFRPLLLAMLLTGCAPEPADTAAPIARAETVPAGDPAEDGPYPVGIATFVLPEIEGQSDVSVEVWYPAAEAGASYDAYDILGLEVPARGYRDAAPDPAAPGFLVAFSHGLGGVRQQNYTMAERLASWGFVVVSPDHPGTTSLEFLSGFGNLKEPLLRRPGTLIGAVDAVYDGAVPALSPRTDGYAVTGHSLGSVTAMWVGGAVFDPEAYAAACAADPRPSHCDLIGPLDVTAEELAAVAPPDPRAITAVLQSPAGHFAFDADSLADIPAPFVQAGSLDDPTNTSEPLYALLADGAVMATYTDAGHNAPTNICDFPGVSSLSPDCDGVAGGYADPNAVRELTVRHIVAWLGVHLGREPAFAEWLVSGEGYAWREE
jgi:predicted dienelactone hydrolase